MHDEVRCTVTQQCRVLYTDGQRYHVYDVTVIHMYDVTIMHMYDVIVTHLMM